MGCSDDGAGLDLGGVAKQLVVSLLGVGIGVFGVLLVRSLFASHTYSDSQRLNYIEHRHPSTIQFIPSPPTATAPPYFATRPLAHCEVRSPSSRPPSSRLAPLTGMSRHIRTDLLG